MKKNNKASNSNQQNNKSQSSDSSSSKQKELDEFEKNFNKFNYTSTSITANPELKNKNKDKNVTIYNFDKTFSVKLHESVIPSCAEVLYNQIKIQTTAQKSFTVTRKVNNESIDTFVNYFYTGKMIDIDYNSILSISALADFFGDMKLFKEVSSHLVDQSFKNDKANVNNDLDAGPVRISFIVGIAITFLIFFTVYFDRLIERFVFENEKLATKLEIYKVKYDNLVNYNKEHGHKVALEEEKNSEFKDYTNENNKLIDSLKAKLKELNLQVSQVEKESTNVKTELIKNQLAELTTEITKRQGEADTKYISEIKRLKKEHNNKLKDSDFKYYYNYNETQRSKLEKQLNHRYCEDNRLYELYDEVQRNITTSYNSDNQKYVKNFKQLETIEKDINVSKQEINKITNNDKEISELRKLIKEKTSNSKRKTAVDTLRTILAIKKTYNSQLKQILSDKFEFNKYYNYLYKAFNNKNFNYRLVFDSKKHDNLDEVFNSLKDSFEENSLLFLAETVEKRTVGGYLSANFPAIENKMMNKEIIDGNSFIFDFMELNNGYNEVFHAYDFYNVHFHVRSSGDTRSYDFGFGNVQNDEGLNFILSKDREEGFAFNASYGKRPNSYNVPINNKNTVFNSNELASGSNLLKSLKIYKIDLLE